MQKGLRRGVPTALAAAIGSGIIGGALYCWIPRPPTNPSNSTHLEKVSGHWVARDFITSGTVSLLESSTLFAPAGGSITFSVATGDAVLKNDILATVDSQSLHAQFEREQATLEKLTAELGKARLELRQQLLQAQINTEIAASHYHAAQREVKRLQDAWELRVIPHRDLDRAEDDSESAQLIYKDALANARAQHDILTFELKGKQFDVDRQRLAVSEIARRTESLVLRSPVTGVVRNIAVRQRTIIPENAELLTIVDLSSPQIEFSIPQAYYTAVTVGMATNISYKGNDYPGVVASLSSDLARGQFRGHVRFADLAPNELKQNDRVELRLPFEVRESVLNRSTLSPTP